MLWCLQQFLSEGLQDYIYQEYDATYSWLGELMFSSVYSQELVYKLLILSSRQNSLRLDRENYLLATCSVGILLWLFLLCVLLCILLCVLLYCYSVGLKTLQSLLASESLANPIQAYMVCYICCIKCWYFITAITHGDNLWLINLAFWHLNCNYHLLTSFTSYPG